MARVKMIGGENVPLTAEEEIQRDAEDQAYLDKNIAWEEEKPARDMAELRTKRNTLLAETDWTQSPDSPLTAEAKSEWATYRQSLRDLPETYASDPDAVVWPEAPE